VRRDADSLKASKSVEDLRRIFRRGAVLVRFEEKGGGAGGVQSKGRESVWVACRYGGGRRVNGGPSGVLVTSLK